MEEIKERVSRMRLEGKSIRAIAKELSVPKATIQRILVQLNGTVKNEVGTLGTAKSGTVKESVPKVPSVPKAKGDSMPFESWESFVEQYKARKGDTRVIFLIMKAERQFGTDRVKELIGE